MISWRKVLPALFLAACAASGCLAHTPAIPGPDGRPLPGSVAALERIELGGMDQWILVRGADTANPVLLRLHGGPGSAEMPVVRRYNGDLEEHFVVVTWDQRGAGKSNHRGFDESSMTFEQFLQDAYELTGHLKERFGQDRIYLMGHSWGSQLGLRLAARHPEDYWAYIGVGQVVDQGRSTELAHGWLTERLAREGFSRDRARLEALGPPPYPAHDDYVTFAKLVDAHGGGMDVGFARLAWAAVRAPEYTILDLRRWIRGANRGSGPMWDTPAYRDHDALRRVPRLDVPAYFFMGRRDYNTPLALVEEYAAALEAPAGKEVVAFEGSAHTPFLGEPEPFQREMVRVKEETFRPRPASDADERRVAAGNEGGVPPTERILLPFLLYTPETKLGGGAVAAGYRRLEPNLPPSSLLGAVTVTTRRQVSIEAVSELHRPGGDRVDAEARFSHFPDRFFGVGPRTPDDVEEAYTSRAAGLKLRLQRQARPGLRVGPQLTFRWEDVVETEEDGLLASGMLTAAEGGNWLGVGAVSTYDTRDHVLHPRQGAYLEASALWYPDALGATGFHRGVLDARRFVPLGSRGTLAYRAYAEGSGGDVPVLLLPSLGGRARLRGYYEGRLRDRFTGSVQGEIRFPLWWRLDGAAFAEVGQVAPRLGDLLSGRAEFSGGAGLRYRVSKDGARIRADFAVGRRGTGLYLTIGEAF